MDVHVGDVIVARKPHPCGGNRFDVLRVGMDFRIRCEKCGREVMLPRKKIEKNIKTLLRGGESVPIRETARPVAADKPTEADKPAGADIPIDTDKPTEGREPDV